MVARLATSISVSKAIAAQFRFESVIIGNPFDDDLFRLMPEQRRVNDVLFVGNLGYGKGVDILLRAVHLLRQQEILVPLTIVGAGGERKSLMTLSEVLGLSSLVCFPGALHGEDLVREYNRHRVTVIPSRSIESFGVVALEAIACGCVVVGTSDGGVPDAIGSVGLTFTNGDAEALAAALRRALQEETFHSLREKAAAHLEQHKVQFVADRYLEVLQQSLVKREL